MIIMIYEVGDCVGRGYSNAGSLGLDMVFEGDMKRNEDMK